MPGMGGKECLKQLRELDKEVKILVATGYTLSGKAQGIMEAGATDLYRRCNTEAKRILAEHQVEPKTDEVLKGIERILQGGQ